MLSTCFSHDKHLSVKNWKSEMISAVSVSISLFASNFEVPNQRITQCLLIGAMRTALLIGTTCHKNHQHHHHHHHHHAIVWGVHTAVYTPRPDYHNIKGKPGQVCPATLHCTAMQCNAPDLSSMQCVTLHCTAPYFIQCISCALHFLQCI